jgi:hypothetical protein
MASDGNVHLSGDKASSGAAGNASAGGSAAGAAVRAAMNDPTVRAEVVANATQAVTHAAQVGWHAAEEGASEVIRYMQTHHWSTSALCLIGGFATIITGLVGLISIKPLEAISRLYLIIFGVVTIMLEVDVEQLQQYPRLSFLQGFIARTQMDIHRELHAFTGLKGRGVFYVFVGLFALSLGGVFAFMVGVYDLLLGGICITTAIRAGPRYPTAAGQMSQPLRSSEQGGKTQTGQ